MVELWWDILYKGQTRQSKNQTWQSKKGIKEEQAISWLLVVLFSRIAPPKRCFSKRSNTSSSIGFVLSRGLNATVDFDGDCRVGRYCLKSHTAITNCFLQE
jgi:hypothetical protein